MNSTGQADGVQFKKAKRMRMYPLCFYSLIDIVKGIVNGISILSNGIC